MIGVRDDLAELEGYHSAQVTVDVRLNTNESPYPPPPAWRDAFLEELAAVPLHRYPDRSATALRTDIGELHGVGPEQVLAGNGSNEVIQALCLAYGGAGRTVAVFEPTYALHSHIPRITGTGVAVGERRPDFTLDPAEVQRVLAEAKPAITFLCSPNNPTGVIDSTEVVEAALAAAPGLVVVDEAYGQFTSTSALPLVDDNRPLVVTRTFSKTWSMAGCRLGYLVAPAGIVAGAERAVLPYHLDAATQIAGRLALRFTAEMEARVAALVAERERLAGALAALPVETWPSGANFLLFRAHDVDGPTVWKGLVERSVLVRDCSSWPRLDGCLRVTVGTPAEDDAFLAALSEVLS
ncbi:MAG TPA: histidinol-phosphate transaminase [Acidimicrobiales bacterium]|nr:histidinol-phosphate transaminase [Acidimicrobiales bacterium]